MFWIVISGILFIISICLGIAVRNIYRNLKISEALVVELHDEVEKALIVYNNIEEKIIWSQTILNDIDKKGLFASDDEIGWFFKNIQIIQDELNGFQFKYKETPKEEEK